MGYDASDTHPECQMGHVGKRLLRNNVTGGTKDCHVCDTKHRADRIRLTPNSVSLEAQKAEIMRDSGKPGYRSRP